LLSGGRTASPGTAAVSKPDPARDAAEKPLVQFGVVCARRYAKNLAQQAEKPYHHAKLVLFRNSIQSECGGAEAATGPFYCPGDERIYVDLVFLTNSSALRGARRIHASLRARARTGPHVQNILGIERKLRQLQEHNPRAQKPLSVKMELQADCFAGIWAHSTQQRGLLEKGDVESALGAASGVGDDRLQKMATGHVNPDSFTHGSSEQRVMWFLKGFDSGSIGACHTFAQ